MASLSGSQTPGAARTSVQAQVTDPIALELLRNRLESIAEDAAITIVRTGVSPTATETHDLSATLLDAQGRLIAGGGWVSYHWAAATHAVRSTIARYGKDIAPGDVFFANDSYSGGGLHPNDVFVERPIFVDNKLVAWVALSAHLADMGGMAVGSYAPNATEVYQEAFRCPPVRLFRHGIELTDVWDIIRTNVRMAMIVEMDLRALVAGSYVAQEKVAELIGSVGEDFFLGGVKALQDLTERELRKRIEAMPDGVYQATGWTDWDDELYKVPCRLTIEGDHMIFDFEGASPQAPHFFNSQPYIIKSAMVMQFARVVAPDLPYTEGLLAPIEMRCPKGTIVNATSPAPVNAGHMHIGGLASEMMLQCVRFALWAASPAVPASRFIHGHTGAAVMSLAMWAGHDTDGSTSVWGQIDGSWSGCTAGADRDGIDMVMVPVGMAGAPSSADVEVMETWYPMLVLERSVRKGINGAGAHRSGGGTQLRFKPYGLEKLNGEMVGTREWVPLEGAAGGNPGSTAIYEIRRANGQLERISTKASGVVLNADDTFELRCASGGGVGDPLDRLPEAVGQDVAHRIITADDARAVYAVILDGDGAVDLTATETCRADQRAGRLSRAKAPAKPVREEEVARLAAKADRTAQHPLYPGIVQRGRVAYAEISGVPLAISPDHWTDGCAVLEQRRQSGGPALMERSYLDPRTGRCLHVEVVPLGEPRAFEISPARWTSAAR
jgi:N-methylhydantoinase B